MMMTKQVTFRVLYITLLTTSICGITQSRSVDITYKAGQRVDDEFIFEERTAKSYLHCANICARIKKCMTASYNTDGSCLLSADRVIFSNELYRLSLDSAWTTYSKRGRYDDCIMIGDQCFAILRQLRNYSTAETNCKENCGRLAEPQNSTLDSLLRTYLIDIPAYYFFGLTDRTVEGQYVWNSDGLEPGYTSGETMSLPRVIEAARVILTMETGYGILPVPAYYFFGLTDRAVEGQYVWNSDGLEPGYTSWGDNEPTPGDRSCACYPNHGDRLWHSTWCTQNIYSICDILV